jgi:predicted DNA-binding protein (UPF0251 family)
VESRRDPSSVFFAQTCKTEEQQNNFLKTLTTELKRERLWNDRREECLGLQQDLSLEYSFPDQGYAFPRTHELLESPQDLAVFLFKIGIDSLVFNQAIRRELPGVKSASSYLGGGAWDLKHSHLLDLFREGHFDEKEGQNKMEIQEGKILKAVAYLTCRGITKESELEMILPALSYPRFHRLQARVYREVEATFPEWMKQWNRVWRSLTPPQQEAIRWTEFENSEGWTQFEIARQLGISLASLKDRLHLAYQKIT